MVANRPKKAQVTLFIIIGVVVVIGAYLIYIGFLSSSRQNQEIQTAAFDFANAKDYVTACLQASAIDAVQIIAHQGGYYILPEISTKGYMIDTAYYLYGGRYLAPRKEDAENQLNKYMDENADSCVAKVNEMQKDVNVSKREDAKSQTSFKENSVEIKVNFPLDMSKEGIVHREEQFIIVLDKLRMNGMLSAARDITGYQQENATHICISCIADTAEKYNFSIDFMRGVDGDVFYQIIDYDYPIAIYNPAPIIDENQINDNNYQTVDEGYEPETEPLIFMFAHKNKI